MMWHIIDAHIKGVTPPFSGDEEMDELLEKIYEKQKILPQDQFLFGRLIGDFFEIARQNIQPQKKSLTRTTYPKIWVYILRYVCAL